MNSLISTEQLYEWFQVKQPSKLIKVLQNNNIKYHLNAVGHPITTSEAVNDSLKNKKTDNNIDF